MTLAIIVLLLYRNFRNLAEVAMLMASLRVINLHVLPYMQDREELYAELSAPSVALMPSWHEGFGLVAWEAIAAGVPLILSKQSGVYQLLASEVPGAGPGCVRAIDVRGAMSHPVFRDEDLKAVATALTAIAQDPAQARREAAELRERVGRYTWSACVGQAGEAFAWRIQIGSIYAFVQDAGTTAIAAEGPAPTAAAAHHSLRLSRRDPEGRRQDKAGPVAQADRLLRCPDRLRTRLCEVVEQLCQPFEQCGAERGGAPTARPAHCLLLP